MTDKQRQLRVGLFAVVAAGLAAVVLIVFGGIKFWRHRDHYVVVFDRSVIGLVNGAQVYRNGIEAGRVEGIALDPADLRRVRVDIALDDATPVRADTRAVLNLAGITGLKVIDLAGGSLAAPAVPPGGTIGHIALELTLTDPRTGEIVWSHGYDQREPLASRTPAGLARALGAAMERIAGEAAPAIAVLAETRARGRDPGTAPVIGGS